MNFIPSHIYEVKNDVLTIGCDLGVAEFSTVSEKSNIITNDLFLPSKDFRSNDGGRCRNHQLLSFMHRNDPVKNFGFVYLVKDESFCPLDDSLHIPNYFVEIEP